MNDQIDIRVRRNLFTLQFPYNEEFVDYIKARVPKEHRHYDGETRTWHIKKPELYLAPIEGVAVQRFAHAVRWYTENDQVKMKNLKTGIEQIMPEVKK